ncbi:MAG: DUF3737 family protein [Muribaculaceae bacterium]|nr:DUF3737 family protein [Muribaculaceae bacterium]
MKKLIKDQSFGGERPLFESHNVRLENVTITEGESGIKECSDIEADHCLFIGKYPFWHVHRSLITNCVFEPGSRSAIWYSTDMVMRDTVINAPKLFREMKNLTLENVIINDADETFWNIDGLTLRNVELHDGTYPFMGSRNIRIDGLKSDSKYVFQYVKNVEIHNAHIETKDAFWEVENVTVYDSELHGEFLGWHSHNLRLVNCHITGQQPLCYAHNLVLENCTFGDDADLMFEYSTVQADIRGRVVSIKNPASGRVVADEVGEIIIDENIKAPADCEIIIREQK